MNLCHGHLGRLKMLLLLVILFSSEVGYAQNTKIVKGIVLDATTNQPLIGATITAVNKSLVSGTITDTNGAFILNTDINVNKLTISLVGYASKDVTIDNEGEISVLLEQGVILSEMVVTAFGLERKSKSIGYAVQQLNGQEVSNVKSANILDNLAGRAAGLTITSGSSGIGSSTKINIRGESSFTNTNPLFIVDGTPVNNNTIVNVTNDDANGFMEVDFGNGAMDINPDDVAFVSVLKGPVAAALYGARASNGAIIIKTKSGADSKGIGVSFNSTAYTDSPFKLPKFQNKYGQGNSGKFSFKDGLGGGINDNITYSYGPKLDEGLLVSQYDSPVILADGRVVRAGDVAIHGGAPITPTPFVSYPDNLKDFYKTGRTLINNLAFTSGWEKGGLRLSLTDLESKSYIPGVNLNRRTVGSSIYFNPTQKLKITSNANYVRTTSNNRPASKYGSENINYALVAWLGRSNDTKPLKDYWQPGLEDVQQFSYNYTFFDNPYFTLLENRNGFSRDRVFGNISMSYELTPDLSFMIRSGLDYQNEDRTFLRAFSTNRFKSGAYAEQAVLYRESNTDFLLNYTKKWSDFSFDVSAGGNQMSQKSNFNQLQTQALAQPGIFAFTNAAATPEYFQSVANKRINSFYGFAKFGYKDFLFVDITGRNDWSSALATSKSSANTSFFYPSISTGFVLSEMIELPQIFSFLKGRMSYAKVGNDTNPFQTEGAFVAKTPVNGLPTFGDQNKIPNSNLQPEIITSLEFGADIRLWDDKLRFDVTYFNSLNENQIISLPISNTSGYTTRSINGGVVRTKGWEIIADMIVFKNQNVMWRTGVNFTKYSNLVTSLPNEAKTITLAYNSIYDNVNQTIWYQVQEGGRMGDMWGTSYLKNSDGDFIIGNDGKYIVSNDLIKLGNYNPDFMVGVSNQFSYKSIQFSFLLDWRQGGQIVSRTLAIAGVGGQLKETEYRPDEGIIAVGVVNVGTAESPTYQANTKAVSPEVYYRQFYDRNHEENNTYSASYLKLREMQISYEFPKNSMAGKLEQIRISLVGRNLYALSKIPHFDPEQFGFQGQKLVSGVEDMSYPTSRSIGLKLNVIF